MARNSSSLSQAPASSRRAIPVSSSRSAERDVSSAADMGWDFWLFRAALVTLASAACHHFAPFGLAPVSAAAAGLGGAVGLILIEFRLRRASLGHLLAGAIGAVVGLLAAYLASLVVMRLSFSEGTRSFLSVAGLLGLGY